MMAGQPRFFTVEERHAAPSAASDPLERLSAVVDAEIFCPLPMLYSTTRHNFVIMSFN